MAARTNYQASSVTVTTTEGQRECARQHRCSAQTRDDEGNWHPAPAAQHICPTDQDVMVTYLGELPPMYERLGELLTDPVRRARPVRVSPGSRVLVSGEADELMHDIADQVGAWAVRVRAVARLSRPEAAYGTLERVTADCGTLEGFPGPMLALDLRDALRTWTFAPSRLSAVDPLPPVFRLRRARGSGARPRPVPCRRCRLLLSPSPSGKYWWPAECAHRAPLLPAGGRDDDGRDDGLLCSACGKRLPEGWQPAPPCRHEASGLPHRASPIPADVEAEIEGLEVVRAGDGWVQCLTPLGGRAAALDVFDLRAKAVKLLRENPAPRDLLDGIPCPRLSCEAMGSLEVLPVPPPDPERELKEGVPDFCRCTICGERMTRTEYDQHVKRYAAWATEAMQSCRKCDKRECTECRWAACKCAASGHRAA
jgi:hypothetical protein